jgi:phosphate butyryltransferase
LQAVLEKGFGLRTGRLLTHVAVFEIPGFTRLILVSDAGVVIAPTLAQRVEITQNAIDVARRLGIEEPRVAILAANEMVNPKLPITMDAASLAKMADRGQIKGGLVDGPLALDNAISPEAAEIKGIHSRVAGEADVLITPDIDSGNLLVKAITYFARGEMAGVVVGAKAPLVLASRSDSHTAKLVSIALSVLLTN